jgi:hypothetical protein
MGCSFVSLPLRPKNIRPLPDWFFAAAPVVTGEKAMRHIATQPFPAASNFSLEISPRWW